MPTCEYCGEDFPKGGAYATHVRYCADRPDSEDRPQSDGAERAGFEDSLNPESQSEGSTDGAVTERSDTSPDTRSTPAERDSEDDVVAAEIRESTDEDQGEEEPHLDAEHASVTDQSSARWFAAIGLFLFLVVVWILLNRGEEDDEPESGIF